MGTGRRHFYVLATLLFCSAVVADDKTPTTHRKYQDGPLKIVEFKASPDLRASGDAYTECNVEFRYKFEYVKEDSQYVATLTSFEAFSVFLPDKSWWKKRADPELLDHEQGHFDIAEAITLRMQIAFERAFQSRRRLRARGETAKAACKALRDKLSKLMKKANEQSTQDNLEYDASTLHGMRFRRQAEQRRIQIATIDRLNKELSALRNRSSAAKSEKRDLPLSSSTNP